MSSFGYKNLIHTTSITDASISQLAGEIGDTSHKSAFGEQVVAEVTPKVQINARNGLNDDLRSTTSSGGSVAVSSDLLFSLQTGTTSGASVKLISYHAIPYKAGQGILSRFSARFASNVANSKQYAGAFTVTDGLGFGYNGTSFGIFHRRGGSREVRTLTLSAGASSPGNVTIVVDDVSTVVAVTAGTAAHVSFEIAAALTAAVSGWTFKQNNGTVRAVAEDAEAKSGTFSFTDTDTTGTTAAWSTLTSGAVPTETWIAESSWNGTALGSTLDPSKMNLYQTSHGHLGTSALRFFILDSTTGSFVLVHTIHWANQYTVSNFGNPSMNVGWEVASSGSTTNLQITSASAMLAVEGRSPANLTSFGHSATKATVTTEVPLMSVRVRNEFQGKDNIGQIHPVFFSASTDSNKGAVFRLLKNCTLGGEPNWLYESENNSITEYDTTATSCTGFSRELVFNVGPLGTLNIDISSMNTVFAPGETLTLTAAVSSGAASEMNVALTWLEDI